MVWKLKLENYFLYYYIAGIPSVILGTLIASLKQNREAHLRHTFILHNPNLTAEQATQLDFLISQNALNPQINEHHFNCISQFLTRLDASWSSIDLTARIDSSLRQVQACYEMNTAKTNAVLWYFDEVLTRPRSDRREIIEGLELIMDGLKKLSLKELTEKVCDRLAVEWVFYNSLLFL